MKKVLKIGILCLGLLLSSEVSLAKDSSKIELPPSWTVTSYTYNITVEEVALQYYGDKKYYRLILKANKNILHGNHIVPKDVEIKIPITDNFRERPEKLGWK